MTRLGSTDALHALLVDLLTPHEIEAIAERWAIIKRIDAGMSQRAIRDQLGASVTTISRGNRQLKYGSGGFHKALASIRDLVEAPRPPEAADPEPDPGPAPKPDPKRRGKA